MPYAHVSKEQLKKIIELHRAGYGYRQIVSMTGVGEKTILRTIREYRTAQMARSGGAVSTADMANAIGDIIASLPADKLNTESVRATDAMRDRLDRRELNAMRLKNTLFEIIGEDILNAIAVQPPPEPVSGVVLHPNDAHDAEEMALMLSDIHGGLRVDQRESGGLGSYNLEILAARAEFLKKSIEIIMNIHAGNTPYFTFNIFALGDWADGDSIYPGHDRQLDADAMQQVVFLVDLFGRFISWLASLPMHINFYGVVGNHGRLGKKGEKSPLNNFDFLIYKMLEKRLSAHKNVKFHISQSWWMIVERCGKKFYCVHGDDVRGWMGLPFYGLERFLGRIKKMLDAHNVNVDYVLAGHFHRAVDLGNILLNGSFPGGTEFSLKQLQVADAPMQKMFSIHPTFGVTWQRNILLEPPNQTSMVEVAR